MALRFYDFHPHFLCRCGLKRPNPLTFVSLLLAVVFLSGCSTLLYEDFESYQQGQAVETSLIDGGPTCDVIRVEGCLEVKEDDMPGVCEDVSVDECDEDCAAVQFTVSSQNAIQGSLSLQFEPAFSNGISRVDFLPCHTPDTQNSIIFQWRGRFEGGASSQGLEAENRRLGRKPHDFTTLSIPPVFQHQARNHRDRLGRHGSAYDNWRLQIAAHHYRSNRSLNESISCWRVQRDDPGRQRNGKRRLAGRCEHRGPRPHAADGMATGQRSTRRLSSGRSQDFEAPIVWQARRRQAVTPVNYSSIMLPSVHIHVLSACTSQPCQRL